MACVRKHRGKWCVDYREPSGRRRIETCETRSGAQDRLAELRTQLKKARKHMRRVSLRAKLRQVRIHDLRHTYASLLIAQGESLAYVRDQLGHHSIQITVDTYGHLVPGGNVAAVDRLDDPELTTSGNKWKHPGETAIDRSLQVPDLTTATRRSRTGDLLITNQLLYRLS